MSQEKPQPTHTTQPQPGDVYEIPPEGSLGLLALGAVGLKLWRQKRDEHQKQQEQYVSKATPDIQPKKE